MRNLHGILIVVALASAGAGCGSAPVRPEADGRPLLWTVTPVPGSDREFDVAAPDPEGAAQSDEVALWLGKDLRRGRVATRTRLDDGGFFAAGSLEGGGSWSFLVRGGRIAADAATLDRTADVAPRAPGTGRMVVAGRNDRIPCPVGTGRRELKHGREPGTRGDCATPPRPGGVVVSVQPVVTKRAMSTVVAGTETAAEDVPLRFEQKVRAAAEDIRQTTGFLSLHVRAPVVVEGSEGDDFEASLQRAQSAAKLLAHRFGRESGPDIVCALVASDSVGGAPAAGLAAFPESEADYAKGSEFSLSAVCMVSAKYTFVDVQPGSQHVVAHEICHLFGCGHETGQGAGLDPWSHANAGFVEGTWTGTVMSITAPVRTPALSLCGERRPQGTETPCTWLQDNEGTLRRTAPKVADFRD